jgi:DNA-binding XRE family transcriptional regulator
MSGLAVAAVLRLCHTAPEGIGEEARMGPDKGGPEPLRATAVTEGRAVSAPSQIGEALWRGRLRLGLSLGDVANRVGADQQTVSAIENSDFARMAANDTTIATAAAYARIVQLPEKWVMQTLAAELAQQAAPIS